MNIRFKFYGVFMPQIPLEVKIKLSFNEMCSAELATMHGFIRFFYTRPRILLASFFFLIVGRQLSGG